MLWIPDALHLTYTQQELVVSIMLLMCAIFSLIAGYVNDKVGRRICIMMASILFTAGGIIMAVANSFWVLLVGRSFVGAAVGLASMSVPPYIAECSPAHKRGVLGLLWTVMISFGGFVASLFGALFSMPWADPQRVGWRLMLALGAIPGALQFIAFLFLPESPRWLIAKGRDDEAEKVLRRMYAGDEAHCQYEKRLILTHNRKMQESRDNSFVLVSMMKSKPVRRALFLGCALQAYQQLSGINTVVYYAATIIQMSGVHDRQTSAWINSGINFVNLMFSAVPIMLVDRSGRRKLLLISIAAVTVTVTFLATGFVLISDDAPKVGNKFPRPDTSDPNLIEAWKTCNQQSLCDYCVTLEQCGFCFYGNHSMHIDNYTDVGSTYGYCLPAQLGNFDQSWIGPCSNKSKFGQSPNDLTWAWNYCDSSYSWMVLVGMLTYRIAFTLGLASMPWLIVSEIFPTWARSQGAALATACNWTFNLIISQTFLMLTEVLHKYGVFYMYACISCAGFVLFYAVTPETKGVPMEQVQNLFM